MPCQAPGEGYTASFWSWLQSACKARPVCSFPSFMPPPMCLYQNKRSICSIAEFCGRGSCTYFIHISWHVKPVLEKNPTLAHSSNMKVNPISLEQFVLKYLLLDWNSQTHPKITVNKSNSWFQPAPDSKSQTCKKEPEIEHSLICLNPLLARLLWSPGPHDVGKFKRDIALHLWIGRWMCTSSFEWPREVLSGGGRYGALQALSGRCDFSSRTGPWSMQML